MVHGSPDTDNLDCYIYTLQNSHLYDSIESRKGKRFNACGRGIT